MERKKRLKCPGAAQTGSDSKVDLSLQYVPEDGDGTKYEGIKTFDLPNDTWTKCEATLKVPAHTGEISIYWQSVYNTNNFMDFYLDEFIMQGIAKSATDEPDTPDLSAGLIKQMIPSSIQKLLKRIITTQKSKH